MDITSSDIEYGTDDGKVLAHLARPSGSGKYPGVVLVHEIFGLDGHTRSVADRLAAEGYVVIAPHLFSSKRFSSALTDESISAAIKFMMSIPPEKQRDDKHREGEMKKLDAKTREEIEKVNSILFVNRPVDVFTGYLSSAVDYLNSLECVNGRIGSVGFCFGGGMSINLGCTGKTDASIIFYGENPSPIDRIKNVKGAVMGLYGGEDHRINSSIHELVKALNDYRKPFTIRVFPGAHHAFFNDTRPMYNKEAAGESWNMVLRFFKQNLS